MAFFIRIPYKTRRAARYTARDRPPSFLDLNLLPDYDHSEPPIMSDSNLTKEKSFLAPTDIPLSSPHKAETHPDVPEDADQRPVVPMSWRLGSVLMICLISFGASWSARLTSSLKSTIKKELDINNTQFALLEASEEFLVTILMMASGILTDRIGGAGMLWFHPNGPCTSD